MRSTDDSRTATCYDAGHVDQMLEFARTVIAAEADAVSRMSAALNESFLHSVRVIHDCSGALVVTGAGKAGHVARKLSATFASTGTPSHFLAPADAVHGDVGAVRRDDVVLALSYSGETDEILRVVSIVKKLGHQVIGMTADPSSSLGRASDVVLATGRISEACPLGLAPTASTTAMLALGDALAMSVMKSRNFTAADFAVYHPAGQLGRKLMTVDQAMTFRAGENLPIASDSLSVGEVLASVSRIKRRSGGIILTDNSGKLTGFFSDGDLRRLIEKGPTAAMGTPVAQVMTRDPKHIPADALASAAMAIMQQYRIDELPVVDSSHRPIGLIDVQDLVVLRMFDVDAV